MAVSFLRRLAAAAVVPVFPLFGPAGRSRARALRLAPGVDVVASPRHASVALSIGPLDVDLYPFARVVHDQIPAPRARAAWGERAPWSDGLYIGGADDPIPGLQACFRELLRAPAGSAPVFGPRDNPVEWRGVGPYGQGGEGMMGGAPYGRRLPMTGDDPSDGLALDRVPLAVGPFWPGLPPNLRLEVEFQGDVIASLVTCPQPSASDDLDPIFHQAQVSPVPLASLEVARARHLLEATSDFLIFHGLDGLGRRLLRLARDPLGAGPEQIRAARRWTRAVALGARGIGVLDGEVLRGPNTRAAGRAVDARTEDPAYADLGFVPSTQPEGDALARFAQRIEEAAQAVALALLAGDRERRPGPAVEGPRGEMPVSDGPGVRPALEAFAIGRPWDALLTTVVSLDLAPWCWSTKGPFSREMGDSQDGGAEAAT